MPENIAISKFNLDELQSVCDTTELEVRRFVFSKVASNLVDDLNILVAADASPPTSINIEVDLRLSRLAKGVDADRLVGDAVDHGFHSAEERAREILACRLKK